VTYPTSITEGEWADIDITVKNTGGSSPEGGISLSIPSFTGSTDDQLIYDDGSSIGTSEYYIDPEKVQGSTIHDRNGNPITASYLLAEFVDNDWQSDEINYLRVKVKPKNTGTGTFTFYVRSAMQTRGGDWINTPQSSPINDQQSWPVNSYSITYEGAEPEWSFVQISDTHIGSGTNARTNLVAVLNKVLKEGKPAFIVNTGDVADTGCDCTLRYSTVCLETGCNQNYQKYLEAIAPAKKAGVPVYSIPGNHDRRRGANYLDYCGELNCFAETLEGNGGYPYRYSFTYGPIMFITLDTGSGNCSGSLTQDDIDFLNGLDKNVKKIILTHHPAMALESDRLGISKLCPDIWQDVHIDEYQEELLYYCEDKSNNVCAVLSGHTHVSNSRAWFVDKYIECLGWWENGTWHHWYPLYVQTGSAGKVDIDKGEYPVFRKIEVIGGEVRIHEVKSLTKQDYNYISAKMYSPAELHVYDSQGQHTGSDHIGGSEREIPNSVYFSHYVVEKEEDNTVSPEEVLIFDPSGDYLFQVIGRETGTYRLEISSVEDGDEIVFEAINIPTSPGAVHDYVIDWDTLSQGQDGVTVGIDTDGDGDYERTLTSDALLTGDEFNAPSTVDNLVAVSAGLVSYDRRTGQFSVNVTVKNTSATVVNSPVWLVIESISNPAVTLAGADGTTADGKPYLDLSGLLGDGKLSPAETITKRLYFNNPGRVQFTFKPSVRGVILP
jgi:hypothetical protein